MTLPAGLGELDFSDWFRSLLAAFIGGGATAVTSGITLNLIDPGHFNARTADFYIMVGSLFATNGIVSAMMFLRQKPVPDYKKVVSTVQVTEKLSPQMVAVTTTEETKVVPQGEKTK